jgi:hypothetical protein
MTKRFLVDHTVGGHIDSSANAIKLFPVTKPQAQQNRMRLLRYTTIAKAMAP